MIESIVYKIFYSLPESSCSPYTVRNTFASVPASGLSPVKTVISYGITKTKIFGISQIKM